VTKVWSIKGKASVVFNLIKLKTQREPTKTLGEIIKEGKC